MEFIIRELRGDDDNKQFLELQRRFLAKMDTYESGFSKNMLLDSVYDSDEEEPCFIAISEGKMVAYAKLSYEEEYYDDKKTILILDIFVLKEYQKYGIGSLLVKKIKEYSLGRNINFIGAAVMPGNMQARQFFKKLGFDEYGRQQFVMPLWMQRPFVSKTNGLCVSSATIFLFWFI